MSIQDRDWYAEEVLKKMGIIERKPPARPGGVSVFWLEHFLRSDARRARRAAWLRLFLSVLAWVSVAGVIFTVIVTITKR